MGKLTKEEIILLYLQDPYKLAGEIIDENVPKSDEIRTLICDLGDPKCACLYAYYVDKSPHPDTRQGACKDPICALDYARYIDKSPHPDTRQGSCKDPECAYYYAEYVDKSPHPDTQQAVQKDPKWKEKYEKWENSLKKK